MDADQIAAALATLAAAAFANRPPQQEQVDEAGAAALLVATQVIVDLHRIADAAEKIAACIASPRGEPQPAGVNTNT